MKRIPTTRGTSIPAATLASTSKLHALHARIGLPPQFAPSTLARALTDQSATTGNPHNFGLSQYGNYITGYYVAEYIYAQYPRLPKNITGAAMTAYTGYRALAAIGREWGIELAPPGDHELGKLHYTPGKTYADQAVAKFVNATLGGVYIHCGAAAAREFIHAHALSRHLEIASLFRFHSPGRELSRLCVREGFEEPVSRMLAETGRKSAAPVFVVGVYSGTEKMGEGAGSSISEAKHRASVNALLGWYLYRKHEYTLPSVQIDKSNQSTHVPVPQDSGAVVV